MIIEVYFAKWWAAVQVALHPSKRFFLSDSTLLPAWKVKTDGKVPKHSSIFSTKKSFSEQTITIFNSIVFDNPKKQRFNLMDILLQGKTTKMAIQNITKANGASVHWCSLGVLSHPLRFYSWCALPHQMACPDKEMRSGPSPEILTEQLPLTPGT